MQYRTSSPTPESKTKKVKERMRFRRSLSKIESRIPVNGAECRWDEGRNTPKILFRIFAGIVPRQRKSGNNLYGRELTPKRSITKTAKKIDYIYKYISSLFLRYTSMLHKIS